MTFNNLSIKQIARLRPCLNSAIIQVFDRYKVFTHGLMEYMLISFLAKRFLKELLSRIFLRIVFVVLKHENLLPIRINHSLVQCPCHGPNKVNLSKTMSFIGALNKEIILISYSVRAQLRSQIYRRIFPLINFQEVFHPTHCYLSLVHLLIFKKISSLPIFSPTQIKFFTLYPLLLEHIRLLNFYKKFQPTLLLEPPLILET